MPQAVAHAGAARASEPRARELVVHSPCVLYVSSRGRGNPRGGVRCDVRAGAITGAFSHTPSHTLGASADAGTEVRGRAPARRTGAPLALATETGMWNRRRRVSRLRSTIAKKEWEEGLQPRVRLSCWTCLSVPPFLSSLPARTAAAAALQATHTRALLHIMLTVGLKGERGRIAGGRPRPLGTCVLACFSPRVSLSLRTRCTLSFERILKNAHVRGARWSGW